MFVGKGAVYSYDPVGSYERETYKAGGSAAAMLQPLLDNQVHIWSCPSMHIYICIYLTMCAVDWRQEPVRLDKA